MPKRKEGHLHHREILIGNGVADAIILSPSNPLELIGTMPSISHALCNLPQIKKFWILTSDDQALISDYLICAHPDLEITFASPESLNSDGWLSQFKKPFYLVNYDAETETSKNIWLNYIPNTNYLEKKINLHGSFDRYIHSGEEKRESIPLGRVRENSQFAELEEYDFSKPNEAIYFLDDRAVKFFRDQNIIAERVARAQTLQGLIPKIDQVGMNHYSYKYVPGKTIYQSLHPGMTSEFLDWCTMFLWNSPEVSLDNLQLSEFQKKCLKFYKDKTMERVKLYWETSGHGDTPSSVNGISTPTLKELLLLIDWGYLSQGTPSRFHGDLQYDNIIFSPNYETRFVLLDWRQSFAGLIEYGDQYYDLAKLYGGLIIPYNSVKQNKFSFSQSGTNVLLNIERSNDLDIAIEEFTQFVKDQNYDFEKIKLLAGVIFINMSPLHHEPFNFFLHHLGKLMLTQSLYA